MKTAEQIKKEMSIINSMMSVFITIVAVYSMYVLNDVFPEANEFQRILLTAPGMVLLVIAMWLLIKPAEVEF